LKLAESIVSTGHFAPHIACYHAQQSGEKVLKAVLVYLQLRFPFRHDLDELRDLIPQGWNVANVRQERVRARGR
jgi:HEPN domain-containing protein